MIQYRSITNLKGNEDQYDGNPFVSTYSMNFANPKDKKGTANALGHSSSQKSIFKQPPQQRNAYTSQNQRYHQTPETMAYTQVSQSQNKQSPQLALNLKEDLKKQQYSSPQQKQSKDRFKQRNNTDAQYQSNKDIRKSQEKIKIKPAEKIDNKLCKSEDKHAKNNEHTHHHHGKQQQQVNAHTSRDPHASIKQNNHTTRQVDSALDKSINSIRHDIMTKHDKHYSNYNTQQVTSANEPYLHKMQLAKGQKRIIDRFVKYPYPTNIITNYKKDYKKSPQEGLNDPQVKEAFNLEKEHKIINPHQMDLKTTTRVDYQPFTVVPQSKGMKMPQKSNAPIIDRSAYKSEFQNWGKSDYLIEKTPQYPVYQLPFKGQSVYAQSFANKESDRMRPESAQSSMRGGGSQMRLVGFSPMQFNYETTQHKDFQPFKILQRPQTSKPRVEVVQTKANPGHFQTTNSRVFTPFENYRPPDVDFMPYP